MRRLARESEGRTAGAPNDAPVVSSAKYTTSADVRGYIPVYEFPLGEQCVLCFFLSVKRLRRAMLTKCLPFFFLFSLSSPPLQSPHDRQ